MVDFEPPPTQRDTAPTIGADLATAGFEDALEIGRGGFGVVYRCLQRSLDRIVAVKVLTSDFDSENLARFLREQRAMGRLTGHPNVVDVLSVGVTSSGRPYIVMPFHPQGSLATRTLNGGRLEYDTAFRLGIKVAGALETAHRLGIVHRDVKPANILLTDYGEPELADFGIAHMTKGFADSKGSDSDKAFETARGIVTGSPAFTAPEVLHGATSDVSADIFSLGATLFSAVTGRPVPDLREAGVPDDVRSVLERAMSDRPSDRPATAAEFGEELKLIQRRRGWPEDDMALPTELGNLRSIGSTSRSTHSRPRSVRTGGQSGTDGRSKQDLLGNLPLDLTSFVGRRRELAETRNGLSTSRLVTIAGVGGVGKTRLARQVARTCERAFSDGVWWVELGDIRDDPLVAEAVTATLGLRNLSARPIQDSLIEYLRPRQLLLVLDNCEQMLDSTAALAQSLLRTCPEVQILTTSREPLGVGGESVLRLSPLTAPDPDDPPSLRGMSGYDAVTLFTERACAAVPDFKITDDNRIAISRICHRLDGLPLPIELAAARLRSISTTQILEHLTDRYQLLTGGNRNAPSRQQTLRLCMDWSYELCAPLEQKLWARLSVFAGGFELDAVEGICATDMTSTDVLNVLTSLIDKSILIREEPTSVVRYRFLDTLREYGRTKLLESGEATELHRRHRDWFERLALQAAAEWVSSRQLQWIARLGREQPNLHEAMEFCMTASGANEVESGLRITGAVFPFWFSRGLFSEARRWFDRILTCEYERPTTARVDTLCSASRLAAIQGETSVGSALVDEGRKIAKALGSPETDALVSHADGVIALFSGDLHRAVASMESACEVFRQEDNPLRRVWALNVLGMAHHLAGDSERAIACYEDVLSITEMSDESVFRGRSCWNLGLTLRTKGENSRAEAILKKGLRLAQLVDDPFGSAWCLEILAWIAADQDRYRHAAVLMGAAETLWQEIDSPAVRLLGMNAHHEECAQRARRGLGQRTIEAEVRKGAKLSARDAIAMALDENPQVTNPPTRNSTSLTKRESEVAGLVAEGLTNKAIAAKLVISQRTAQGHVEHILTKLGFTSRAQIAGWFVEREHNVT